MAYQRHHAKADVKRRLRIFSSLENTQSSFCLLALSEIEVSAPSETASDAAKPNW